MRKRLKCPDRHVHLPETAPETISFGSSLLLPENNHTDYSFYWRQPILISHTPHELSDAAFNFNLCASAPQVWHSDWLLLSQSVFAGSL
jgi:hypothetical protein